MARAMQVELAVIYWSKTDLGNIGVGCKIFQECCSVKLHELFLELAHDVQIQMPWYDALFLVSCYGSSFLLPVAASIRVCGSWPRHEGFVGPNRFETSWLL